MEKKMEFIRCPRCELNFISKADKYCSVCKKDMESAFMDEKDLDLDMVLDLDICPICKTNYINEDEVMCANCQKEYSLDNKNSSVDREGWDDDEDDGTSDVVETEEDGLGEMVNAIDVEEEAANIEIEGLDELEIGIPLDDEDVDFSDEFDDDDDMVEEEEDETYQDDFEDDFDYDDFDDDDFDDDDDDDDDFDDDDDDFDDDDDDDDYDEKKSKK